MSDEKFLNVVSERLLQFPVDINKLGKYQPSFIFENALIERFLKYMVFSQHINNCEVGFEYADGIKIDNLNPFLVNIKLFTKRIFNFNEFILNLSSSLKAVPESIYPKEHIISFLYVDILPLAKLHFSKEVLEYEDYKQEFEKAIKRNGEFNRIIKEYKDSSQLAYSLYLTLNTK